MRIYLSMFIALLLFMSTVKADIIVNSQDWRDVYLVILYAKFKGEDVHYILNLGETDILLKTLPKNETHTIFESARKPVIKNLKQFMRNYGFSIVSETIFNDYNDLQISLYSDIKNKTKGFIVINLNFGYDAISVFPLAVVEERWVLFYNRNYGDRILNLLKNEAEKDVVFYGEFLSQPWKKIPNSYEVFYDSPFERNKKIVERVWREVDGWVSIADGSYIEKGFLIQGKPILLIRDSPQAITDFLKKLKVKVVEIIGPENVDFGYQIGDLSNGTIGVVAKIGRTFTGDPELRGKFYTLPEKPVDVEIHDLRLEKILWNNREVILVLKNHGNVKEFFKISALRLIGKEEYPVTDDKLHVIKPGETVSIPFYGNFSSLREAEVFIIYGNDKLIFRVKNQTTGKYFFSPKFYPASELKKPEIEGIFYDDSLEKLWIKVKNPNKRTIWMRAEIHNFTFLNKSIILSSSTVKIPPGEGYIPISIYMDKEDMDVNKNLSILIFYGPSEDILTDSYTFSQKKPIKPQRIDNTLFILIIVALILVFIAVILVFTRKGIISLDFIKNIYIREK